jgi:hypothetical protein
MAIDDLHVAALFAPRLGVISLGIQLTHSGDEH